MFGLTKAINKHHYQSLTNSPSYTVVTTYRIHLHIITIIAQMKAFKCKFICIGCYSVTELTEVNLWSQDLKTIPNGKIGANPFYSFKVVVVCIRNTYYQHR